MIPEEDWFCRFCLQQQAEQQRRAQVIRKRRALQAQRRLEKEMNSESSSQDSALGASQDITSMLQQKSDLYDQSEGEDSDTESDRKCNQQDYSTKKKGKTMEEYKQTLLSDSSVEENSNSQIKRRKQGKP